MQGGGTMYEIEGINRNLTYYMAGLFPFLIGISLFTLRTDIVLIFGGITINQLLLASWLAFAAKEKHKKQE